MSAFLPDGGRHGRRRDAGDDAGADQGPRATAGARRRRRRRLRDGERRRRGLGGDPGAGDFGGGTSATSAEATSAAASTSTPGRHPGRTPRRGLPSRVRPPPAVRPQGDTMSKLDPTISRIAVVTGGTAGLGRAIVRELADARAGTSPSSRAARTASRAPSADVRGGGAPRPAASAPTSPTATPVEAAADAGRGGARRRSTSGSTTPWSASSASSSTTDPDDFERATPGQLLRLRQRHPRRAVKRMVPRDRGPRRSRSARPSRTAASRCRPPTAPRSTPCTGFTESVTTELIHNKSHVRISQVDMPAMNTIQFNWVQVAAARPPAAGADDLPARGRRPGRRRRRRQAAPPQLDRRADRHDGARQPVRGRASSTSTSPRPATPASRRPRRREPMLPTTSTSPWPATRVPEASSATRPRRRARRSGTPSTAP